MSPGSEHLPSCRRVELALSKVLKRALRWHPYAFIHAQAQKNQMQMNESAGLWNVPPDGVERTIRAGQVLRKRPQRSVRMPEYWRVSGGLPIIFPSCCTGEQTRLTPLAQQSMPSAEAITACRAAPLYSFIGKRKGPAVASGRGGGSAVP